MKAIRALLALALLSLSVASAAQDAFPGKPIRLIVPYPPGGVGDATARMIAPAWGAALNQTIVIENRGGAGSNIGLDAVAKSAPDGYTIGLFDTALVVNPALYPSMPYEAQRDLAPISLIARGPLVLVVNPAFPANTANELVALAKAKPGSISYASAGNGTPVHLAMEMLKSSAGIDLVHVPYKGAGPAITDVLGGQVPVLFAVPGTALQHVNAGKLRALAITGETRFKRLPNVPTFAESGVQGVDGTIIIGFTVPAKTPPAIVKLLASTLARVLATSEVADKLADFGLTVVAADPQRSAKMLAEEAELWAKVVRSSGAKVE
ncbi:MAG: tripartite tricarboxylate transporter substrate binding protein [Burkholderiales bacterium]|nr:tripartite tricarboxylate transporter substrate binding protein [Burkholderiales bacterium]